MKEKLCKRKAIICFYCQQIEVKVLFCNSAGTFLFPFVRTKEKETKRKSAGCRSGAKKSLHFPKRKELATLKQLFVLHGKYSIFLNAPTRRPEKAY